MTSLRSAWIAPALLIAVGCLQMVGDLTDIRAIKAVGAATGSSPAPKVFTAHKGFETYSSQFSCAGPTRQAETGRSCG